MLPVIAGLCALIAVVSSFLKWKKAIFFLFVWIVMVGALRKWIVPQAAQYLFFSVHIVLLGIYTRIILSNRLTLTRNRTLNCMIFIWLGLAVVSLFNPRMPNLAVGLVGLVVHFFYIPVIMLPAFVFKNIQSLDLFIKRIFYGSVPLLIFCFLQYFSPLDHPINKYLSDEADIAQVGGMARITGTFSYCAVYASYLSILFLFGMALFSSNADRKIKETFFLLVVVFLIALNLFMTGYRLEVFMSGISFFMYSFFSYFARRGKIKRSTLTVIIIVFFFGLGATQLQAFKTAFQNFTQRVVTSNAELIDRVGDTFTPFKFIDQAGFFGYGVGTTYQGATSFVSDWGQMPRDFEEEPERILLELGGVGFFVVYGLRWALLIYSFKIYSKLRNKKNRAICLALTIFQIKFLFLANLIFYTTTSLYYWFFIGIILHLPRLDADSPKSVLPLV